MSSQEEGATGPVQDVELYAIKPAAGTAAPEASNDSSATAYAEDTSAPPSKPAVVIHVGADVQTATEAKAPEGLMSPTSEEEDEVKFAEEEKKPDAAEEEKKKQEEALKKVPLTALFRFATCNDIWLIVLGTLGAIAAGACLPLFSIIFGEVLDTLNETNADIMDAIVKLALYFVYLGIGVFVTSWMELSFWMIAAESQVKRLREAYLRALLRQDISWHDFQRTGDLATKLTGDTRMVQEAISSKFSQLIHHTSTFLAGLLIGFIKGWELTLIIFSLTPAIMIAGGVMSKVLAGASAAEQKAYGDAGVIANEALSNIRTVVSFQGEERELDKYEKNLTKAYDQGVKKAVSQGAGLGSVFLVMFSAYGFALWYGSTLIVDKKERWPGSYYTGGDVVAIFFAVIIGTCVRSVREKGKLPRLHLPLPALVSPLRYFNLVWIAVSGSCV